MNREILLKVDCSTSPKTGGAKMATDEAISSLEMCQALMLFDPLTGETHELWEENRDNQDLYNACTLAIDALRAQSERENPKPLTPDELRQMVDSGEWAWVEMNFGTVGWCKPFQKFPLSMRNVYGGFVTELDFEQGFIKGVYRHEPKDSNYSCSQGDFETKRNEGCYVNHKL